MSDKEEKKESKKKSVDAQKAQLEEYLSDKQSGQYQNNKQFKENDIIVHAGTTDNNEHIIYVFGKYIPNASQKKEFTQFKRYFYFFLDELVEQKYYLFYFHSGLSSYSYVQQMYILLKKLPEKYYNNLQRFYIVNPSFLVKSYNFFNTPSCLKNKLDYLKSVKNVYDLNFFKTSFYKKIQNYVKLLSNSDPQTSKSQDEEIKDKLFGLDLDDLELNEQQIPKIIVEFIDYFKGNEEHIKEQGIFRKAPREYDIKIMEKELINKNYTFIQNHEDPHVVATSLKRLLSNMPEPIFPFKQYELVKQLPKIIDPDEKKLKVHSIVEQIPILNFRVLRHIIDLLRTVSRYSDSNLMKMEALTKIFAPTLIRCQSRGEKMEEALEELRMNPTVVEVVQIIYQDYDEIFSSRTMDEQVSNNILKSILEDLPENQDLKIQNPYLNQQQYNYLVSRDSNIYIADNTENGNIPNQAKNLSSNKYFIDEHGHYSEEEEDEDEKEEDKEENNQKVKKIKNFQYKNGNFEHFNQYNYTEDVIHQEQQEEHNNHFYQGEYQEEDDDDDEGEEEEFQIRSKSNAIQIDDPIALRALRGLLNAN